MSTVSSSNQHVSLDKFIILHSYFKENSYQFLEKKRKDKSLNINDKLATNKLKREQELAAKKEKIRQQQEELEEKRREEEQKRLVLEEKEKALKAQKQAEEDIKKAKEQAQREKEQQLKQQEAERLAAEAEQKRLALEAQEKAQQQEVLRLQQLEKERISLIQQATDFISSGVYEPVFLMMKNGYSLTFEQKNQMKIIFDSLLHSELTQPFNDEQSQVEYWLSQDWQMNSSSAIELLFNPYFQQHYNMKLFEYTMIDTHPLLSVQLIDLLQTEEFQVLFFHTWKESLASTDGFNKIDQQSLSFIMRNHHEYLFKSVANLAEFVELTALYSTHLQRVYNPYLDNDVLHAFFEHDMEQQVINIDEDISFMNSLTDIYFSDGINHLLNRTSIVFSQNTLLQEISQQMQQVSKHIQFDSIIPTAQPILNDIGLLVPDLKTYSHLLDENTQEQVSYISSVLLPQTLYNYFSIPQVYRTQLFNAEGENIHDILIKQLSEQLLSLQQAQIQLNKKKLNI